MRKRELRPFTVEVKSKRRSISTPPASIWGDTEKLFRAPPSQASGPVSPKSDEAIVAPAPAATEPAGEIHSRRILPDLRAAQIEVAEDAVAIRIKERRPPKSDREHLPREERHPKRRKQAVVVVPDVDVVSTSSAKVVLTVKKKRGKAQTFTPSIAPSSVIVVTPRSHVEIAHTPIIAQQASPRRDRKWVRGIDELSRGERWKRRLPEVCR